MRRSTVTNKQKSHAKRQAVAVKGSWKDLRDLLVPVGFKRSYLEDTILPSWWEESVLSSRNGFLETLGIIHQRTGLSLEALVHGRVPAFSCAGGVRFKRTKGLAESEIRGAHTLARQVAETVAEFYRKDHVPTYPTAEQIHLSLKASGTSPWVELEDVLTFCGDVGIPVLFVDHFPAGFKKPDGLAIRSKTGRPVIVLCRRSSRPAWMLFTLAHELGHIVLGHVPKGGVWVDGDITAESEEKEERDANVFASIVLTGHDDLGLHSSGKMNACSLACAAKEFARKYRVSPGVACLNWGRNTGHWQEANGAVKILEGNKDAIEIVRRLGTRGLDSGSLPPDVAEWLAKMGVGV
jgi:hypothetical protein